MAEVVRPDARSQDQENHHSPAPPGEGSVSVTHRRPPEEPQNHSFAQIASPPVPVSLRYREQTTGHITSVETVNSRHSPVGITHTNPLSTELHLDTEFPRRDTSLAKELGFGHYPSILDRGNHEYNFRGAMPNDNLPARTSSVKSLAASHRSLSPASVMSSPSFGPLAEITPLPSPLGSKSGSWVNIPASLGSPLSPASQTSPTNSSAIATSPPRKKRSSISSQGTSQEQVGHPLEILVPKNRTYSNRSSSEYLPPAIISRVRNVAPSSSHTPLNHSDNTSSLQREEYVAPQRGLTGVAAPAHPPTPPKSQRSATDSESESAPESKNSKAEAHLQYDTRTIRTNKLQHWIGVRKLGVGTFSTVMLATSDLTAEGKAESQLDPMTLVAVKICEHGPAGGADEKKIEASLKRELEILKSIHHPSLVHLRAVSVLEKRAFLVLDYAAGGDLFELASLKNDLLVPTLIQRIFAELVDAVSYLHQHYIVHRDIKLENVLVNPPLHKLAALPYATYPFPIVTLTDLGLGRVIPRPPESPLLRTRCGSEDYAAPEVLMGQEYDGRHTDAWALGVLLYALIEGRLPFDPVPGARRASPTSHRIARCEWRWLRWGNTDGDWDAGASTAATASPDSGKAEANTREAILTRGQAFEGARVIIEGLLKRASRRWTLAKVIETAWVRRGIQVDGGIHREIGAED